MTRSKRSSKIGADAGAFDAACLMVGCALEAALLANVLAFEPDMERDGTWPDSKKPPEEWHLPELIRFHREAGWIKTRAADPRTSDEPQLADAVEIVNWLRNLVAHPGRLIRLAPEITVDEKAFATMYGILQATFVETNELYP